MMDNSMRGVSEARCLPAYGLQLTLLERGQVDTDGRLVTHPLTNLWNLLLITGPLDTELLADAVAEATAAPDALQYRLRTSASAPVCLIASSPPKTRSSVMHCSYQRSRSQT